VKLLYCLRCHDAIMLIPNEIRSCKCGRSSGRYVDDINAEISGDDAVCIGFSNPSFWDALCNQPQSGLGSEFTAFVIPKECGTVKKVNTIRLR
jgi:hypothetical protein